MSDKYSKKPEKLASAVYLISGFFPDQEPMKWKMRSLASDLATRSAVFKDGFSPEEKEASLSVRKTVLELTSLLSVAKDAGLISPDNYEIISKEFMSLNTLLESPTRISEYLKLPEGESAGVERLDTSVSRSTPEGQEVLRDKFIKDTENEHRNEGYTPSTESNVGATDTGTRHRIDEEYMARQGRQGKPTKLKDFGVVSAKKSNRKSIIIGLLKRKKEIMIKDVSPLIEGCSEKTIQRELLSMVKEGILKKEGEKRWSKYSLA